MLFLILRSVSRSCLGSLLILCDSLKLCSVLAICNSSYILPSRGMIYILTQQDTFFYLYWQLIECILTVITPKKLKSS